jgi:predicted dehydrogenase/NADPH:quinone reductase-like Zn-dependent oxidoreductase
VRHLTQRPRDGSIAVRETPEPALRPGWVLVANRFSLISAGTERKKVELGEKNLIEKARARPDLVRKVVQRARVEGVRSAYGVARDRLDALAPLGYSSAGRVLRVGAGVEGIVPGDAVACAGAGLANHAEVVSVPKNLVAKVPDAVDLADAAYATVGAIALHAVRQSAAAVGERVGVIGLGLVGQLAVQILDAAGCLPFGVDVDQRAVDLAAASGARACQRTDPSLEAHVRALTDGLGLDAVLICATTASNDPVEQAVRLARDRSRIVVVGNVPVAAGWAELYEKELEIRLSRSYGPGRYDVDYEERGKDLPPGYVRWTEQRNLQAFLELVATGRVNPSSLTTHRLPLDRAAEAYDLLAHGSADGRAFGILLDYGDYAEGAPARRTVTDRPRRPLRTATASRIGLIGAGSFARATLLPALRRGGAVFAAVASEQGLSAADVALRFGFERAAASAAEIVADDDIDAVVVATRHSSHAELAAAALRAGKAVLVEKPLALTDAELAEVEEAALGGPPLMVGFNRRFAPLTARLRAELPTVSDRILVARVNAGPLGDDHWMHDPEDGGGRLLGEGCHFVDLLAHIAGERIVSVHAHASPQPLRPLECSDSVVATLRFADGTVGALAYSGSGDTRLAKERIEAFGGGTSLVLDDFRRLELFRNGRRTVTRARQDKGHGAEVACFLDAVAGRGDAPAVATYLDSTRATLALVESLRSGLSVDLG